MKITAVSPLAALRPRGEEAALGAADLHLDEARRHRAAEAAAVGQGGRRHRQRQAGHRGLRALDVVERQASPDQAVGPGGEDVGGELDDVALEAGLLQRLVAVRRRPPGHVDLARDDAQEAERQHAGRVVEARDVVVAERAAHRRHLAEQGVARLFEDDRAARGRTQHEQAPGRRADRAAGVLDDGRRWPP